MTIKVAGSAGFCYGVKRAVEICRRAAGKYGNCVTLGPIIHNKHVISDLENIGVKAVSNISDLSPVDTVIIRSHGACKQEYEALTALGVNVIDATCPDVKKIHDIVQRDSNAGRLVLVIGQRDHPEIKAICSRCRQFLVFESVNELEDRFLCAENTNFAQKPISVVFQTTSTNEDFKKFSAIIKKVCTNPIIYGTVCNATDRRQAEAIDISQNADAVIIVGDLGSTNSLKLAEICKKHCGKVLFAQSADDIDPAMFPDSDVIGITAGASTPAFIIKEVIAKMSNETEKIMDGTAPEPESMSEATQNELLPVPENADAIAGERETADASADDVAPPVDDIAPPADESKESIGDSTELHGDAEESFEALLEQSIKTFHAGDKVSGVVTSITATEISLDLGAKQSGYIPISEFTDDENNDINEIIKIGDTVESYVTRVNDVEGMIILSKKRLDAVKNWDVVTSAKDNREIVQGNVIQENRGGVVANVKGVHVFIPASQTGLSKSEPMSELLGKKVKLRINEVNQSRRRVIGSIRDAQKDERREKSEKLWNDIEVGKQYDGVVKSMTSYGVFVDIGGVDGMIHISELSWKRIKQPSEILSVGDEISVYVISFDKESRKISLGYKKGEDNPWIKFAGEYSVGDVVNVKIVKMMPFGAFAEICPGVDGLIHISQIAEHRIGIPSEVLSEGQLVDVKITEIDNDRKKVSLSIKALIEPSSADSAFEPEPEPGSESEPEPAVELEPEPESAEVSETSETEI